MLKSMEEIIYTVGVYTNSFLLSNKLENIRY